MDTQSVGVGKSQGAERARKVPPKQGGKEEGAPEGERAERPTIKDHNEPCESSRARAPPQVEATGRWKMRRVSLNHTHPSDTNHVLYTVLEFFLLIKNQN